MLEPKEKTDMLPRKVDADVSPKPEPEPVNKDVAPPEEDPLFYLPGFEIDY